MDKKRKDELWEMLDWDQPISVQNEAVDAFIKEGDEELFGSLLPDYHSTYMDKRKMDNVVLILRKVGYPANRMSVTGLLFLLQDTNWPGADQGVKVLLAMDRPYLLPYLEQAIKLAYQDNDGWWLYGINYLIEQGDISEEEFADPDTMKCFELLEREEY